MKRRAHFIIYGTFYNGLTGFLDYWGFTKEDATKYANQYFKDFKIS